MPFDFMKPAGNLRGLTMIVDAGLTNAHIAEVLEMASDYVDLAKIKVGTAALYEESYLNQKIAAYRKGGLDVFPGGQFLEYLIHSSGLAAADQYFTETARLGFTAVEISDNVVPLGDEDRLRLIDAAKKAGLKVFSEVGSKQVSTDADDLIRQARLSLDANADLVLLEAAEFVEAGRAKAEMLQTITDALDMSRVMIELPGPWISTVTLSLIEDIKKELIRSVGPCVNLGNVEIDSAFELEGERRGLGVAGPSNMQS